MRHSMFLMCASLLGLLVGCVTSSELVQRDDYVDPTAVQTIEVENPALVPRAREELLRDHDVLKGRLEEAEYKNHTLTEENQKLQEEIEQLKKTQASNTLTFPGASPPAAPTPTDTTSKKNGAPLLWELAKKDLKDKKYQQALSPLTELTTTYPKDPRAYFALLAIPMAHYQLENYRDAAVGFNQVIDKFPKRAETSLAWFGQGAAFFKLGQKEDSRLFYGETIKRFPKSAEARLAKKYVARKKGGAPHDLFETFPRWAAKSPRD